MKRFLPHEPGDNFCKASYALPSYPDVIEVSYWSMSACSHIVSGCSTERTAVTGILIKYFHVKGS
jgi:hypothetical protein